MITGVIIALNALSAGISQSLISGYALEAINIQPAAKDDIATTAFISMALLETAGIIGTLFSIAFIVFPGSGDYAYFAPISAVLVLSIVGVLVTFASIAPAKEALFSIARQPFLSKKINTLILTMLSLLQTSFMFAFILAIIFFFNRNSITSITYGMRILASAISLSFGVIGPVIGVSTFASSACRAVSRNKSAYSKIFTFTFLSQAIIETPILFALVMSLIFLFSPVKPGSGIFEGLTSIISSLSIGVGTLGAGIASGKTAAAACEQISNHIELYPILSKTSMLAQGLIDASAIYAFALSLMIFIISN